MHNKHDKLLAGTMGIRGTTSSLETSTPASPTPIRIWLESMLQRRELLRPDCRMLFAYDLSREEFDGLEILMADSCEQAGGFENFAHMSWAFPPIFVLYAAEWWKHHFDGGLWDWSPIVARLGGQDEDFPAQLRSECVTRGLRFWGHRPLADGKRFIGAIAAHGGIPMRLLAQGAGSLAVVLGQVLKLADRYHWTRRLITEGIDERSHALPAAYRRPEISNLLAGFAETVLQLKAEYHLADHADPIDFLDKNVTGWRRRFPISIESDAAQALLLGLIREVAAQRSGTSLNAFHCERRLASGPRPNSYMIESLVIHAPRADAHDIAQLFGLKDADTLPRYFSIDLATDERRGFLEARMVLGAETPTVSLAGRRILLSGAAALTEHQLMLRGLQADLGAPATVVGGGALLEDDPWVFVPRDDGQIRFAAAGSVRLAELSALLVLPLGWRMIPDEGGTVPERLGTLEGVPGTREVYKINQSVRLVFEDLSFRVQLGQAVDASVLFQWSGTRLHEARGKLVFKASSSPNLYRVGEAKLEKVPLSDQHWRRQGTSVDIPPKEARGPIEVLVRDVGDALLGRQKIFILSADARVEYRSGMAIGTASIRLMNWGAIDVGVDEVPNILAEVSSNPVLNEVVISLETEVEPPAEIKVYVRWSGCNAELPLSLPYPVTGGRFVRGDGSIMREGEKITVADLIGTTLQVFDTNPAHPKAYSLQLSMGNAVSTRLPIVLDGVGRAEVRLLDHKKHLESLLGMSDALDAQSRLAVIVGNTKTCEILVARYATTLERDASTVRVPAEVLGRFGTDVLAAVHVLASPLVAGIDAPIMLAQMTSEEVPAGAWGTHPLSPAFDPWLIYPAATSSLQFRPMIWAAAQSVMAPIDPTVPAAVLCPLGAAMAHPESHDRWEALHGVLVEMRVHLGHPSWVLLNRMWNTFHRLSLSALDVWRVLGKQPKMVAAFLMRAEIPDEELAEAARRLRDEVSWVPELSTLKDWQEVVSSLWFYWSENLPEDLRKAVFLAEVARRFDLLRNEIPSLCPMLDLISFELTGVASIALLEIMAASKTKTDTLLRNLWEGGESIVNAQLLLVNAGRPQWPEKNFFDEALAGFSESCTESNLATLRPIFMRLFWSQRGDFKFTVASMPMLCALWSATSTSRRWWGDPKNRLALKRVRDFDPVWFEQGYRHSYALLLSIRGLAKPGLLMDLSR